MVQWEAEAVIKHSIKPRKEDGVREVIIKNESRFYAALRLDPAKGPLQIGIIYLRRKSLELVGSRRNILKIRQPFQVSIMRRSDGIINNQRTLIDEVIFILKVCGISLSAGFCRAEQIIKIRAVICPAQLPLPVLIFPGEMKT